MRTLLALSLTFATASSATAGNIYGAFVLRNPNDTEVRYQIKWGDGEWKSYTVGAGRAAVHSHTLDAGGTAPVPRIRFDDIGGDGRTTWRTYRLDFYSVRNPNQGPKPYRFEFSGGRYIDLISER